MNEEELLREARIRSVAEPEELTFGELAGELELGAERERRFLQALALVAYRHAVLTARALAGQSLPPVGEAFPFWTEEELRQYALSRLAKHKCPRYFSFVKEFPMNAAGKILKYKMREDATRELGLDDAAGIDTAKTAEQIR